MTQNQVPNPYTINSAATPTAGSPAVGASPSALGVKPDARLAAAFLIQAFMWMFAGLLVTAGVAYTVQTNERLLEFADENFFSLFIAQLGLVVAISAGDQADQRDRGAWPSSSSMPPRSASRSG